MSYNHKHNEANGEDNRDGSDNNYSWNCGAEGPTDDPDVNALRNRQMRNFLATLLFSQGVPMLVAGDEFGRTQGGNNNAYCQDNEISWLDWEGIDEQGKALLAFTRKLIALRSTHIVFHRKRFFAGHIIPGTEVKDVVWLRPDGVEMTEDDWGNGHAKAIAVRLSGEAGLMHLTERGEQEPDDTFLVLLNASHESVSFEIPRPPDGCNWEIVLDTADENGEQTGETLNGAGKPLQGNSMRLLVLRLSGSPGDYVRRRVDTQPWTGRG